MSSSVWVALCLDSSWEKKKLNYNSVPKIENLPLLGLFPLISKDS